MESKIVSSHPEIFDVFLEDCWTALATFKDVSGNLAGMISADAGPRTALTDAETLIKVMERLKTCSKKVSGLPSTGMAIACQSLLETACELQINAGKLVEKSAGF